MASGIDFALEGLYSQKKISRSDERRFVLKSLLGQDARGVLSWLATHAHRSSLQHRQTASLHELASGYWVGRAMATAQALEALAATPDVMCHEF